MTSWAFLAGLSSGFSSPRLSSIASINRRPGAPPGFRETANYAEFYDNWIFFRILWYPYTK